MNPDLSNSQLGSTIRKIRLERGYTQEVLAYRSGITHANVQRIEGNKYLPHWKTLGKLAKGLGLTVSELVIAAEESQDQSDATIARQAVQIGRYEFHDGRYDSDADVLYLARRAQPAVDWDETPDGHAIGYDKNGTPAHLTLVGARRLINDAAITLVLPTQNGKLESIVVKVADLDQAIHTGQLHTGQ